eukprot:1158566-Pelagomonas_calceolata.AAC.1
MHHVRKGGHATPGFAFPVAGQRIKFAVPVCQTLDDSTLHTTTLNKLLLTEGWATPNPIDGMTD